MECPLAPGRPTRRSSETFWGGAGVAFSPLGSDATPAALVMPVNVWPSPPLRPQASPCRPEALVRRFVAATAPSPDAGGAPQAPAFFVPFRATQAAGGDEGALLAATPSVGGASPIIMEAPAFFVPFRAATGCSEGAATFGALADGAGGASPIVLKAEVVISAPPFPCTDSMPTVDDEDAEEPEAENSPPVATKQVGELAWRDAAWGRPSGAGGIATDFAEWVRRIGA